MGNKESTLKQNQLGIDEVFVSGLGATAGTIASIFIDNPGITFGIATGSGALSTLDETQVLDLPGDADVFWSGMSAAMFGIGTLDLVVEKNR